MSPPAPIRAGQLWTSTSGAPALLVLERSSHGDDAWLVKSQDDGVMTIIDEWRLLNHYELATDDIISRVRGEQPRRA